MVVSHDPSFGAESTAHTQETGSEMLQNGSEELCAFRLESSAVPPSSGAEQNRQEEDVRPGTLGKFLFPQRFQMRSI